MNLKTVNGNESGLAPPTLLSPPQLPLDLKPLPNQPLLLPRSRTEDELPREINNPSAATNNRNGTRLTAPKPTRTPNPTDDNQKQIHEPMPPRQTRTERRTSPIIPPLPNRTQNPTTIQRLNATHPPPPRPNQRERLRDQL
jgi:hypothetical protein